MQKGMHPLTVAGVITVAASFPVVAGQVSGLNVFTPGTTISASQINSNFTNLQGGVNDNHARIGDLSGLGTTHKKDLAGALNEVHGSASALDLELGDLSTLVTSERGDLVIALNEVAGAAAGLRQDVGDLASLATTDTKSLTAAINGVHTTASAAAEDVGDLTALSTTAKSDLVAAINGVHTTASAAAEDVGDLTALSTTAKGNLVAALNEVASSSGSGGGAYYGDGSAGSLNISVATDWSVNPPANYNLNFTDVTIGAQLTVPSGTVIRCTGSVTVSGSIVVGQGAVGAGSGPAPLGLARAHAGSYLGGLALNALQWAAVTQPGPFGGGAGGNTTHTETGAGGGSLVILAQSHVYISLGAKITANGQAGVYPQPLTAGVVGPGGGGGGVVVLASDQALYLEGSISCKGGNGGDGWDGNGGDGELGGGGGGGGVIHLVAPELHVFASLDVSGGAGGANSGATTSSAATGQGGGASGGDGGDGGYLPWGGTLQNAQAGSKGLVLQRIVQDPSALFN